MPVIFLSEKDRDLLQELLDKERGDRVNTPSRPPMDRSWEEAEDHQAPETYIALPPAGGIPAMSFNEGATTGTSDDVYTPGSADCDIYKIVDGVLTDTGFTKTVYNLSFRDISQVIQVESCPEVTLITSVCFDTTDCTLTICDRSFCLPLGTKIQPEDCGDAGTGTGVCDVATGTGVTDEERFNFILIHRDKYGKWLAGVGAILDCETPGTGTDSCT